MNEENEEEQRPKAKPVKSKILPDQQIIVADTARPLPQSIEKKANDFSTIDLEELVAGTLSERVGSIETASVTSTCSDALSEKKGKTKLIKRQHKIPKKIFKNVNISIFSS